MNKFLQEAVKEMGTAPEYMTGKIKIDDTPTNEIKPVVNPTPSNVSTQTQQTSKLFNRKPLLNNSRKEQQLTTLRKMENLQEKKTYTEKPSHSNEISALINKSIKEGRKIWLCSDWHLWVKDKNNPSVCHKRPNFNQVIANIKNTCSPGDLMIYLGDLVDGEFQNQMELKQVLLSLPPKDKIMVRGNNDLFKDHFYNQCGFKYVVYSFIWNDILFTHPPVENTNKLNIHGHHHYDYRTNPNKQEYWVSYTNQMCVFNEERKPEELNSVIKRQPEHARHVYTNEEKRKKLKAQIERGIFEYAMIQMEYANMIDPSDL